MRIFATTAVLMLTWHWKGDKNVPVSEEAKSKLALSMPVIWFGDGTMDFVVVWSKPGSKVNQSMRERVYFYWSRNLSGNIDLTQRTPNEESGGWRHRQNSQEKKHTPKS